ncbi:dNA-directed DNA polymerase [Clostridium sp. CAG:813]|nr:dNA-directed DNA polymerase [Clostridium sp. CAG:813]
MQYYNNEISKKYPQLLEYFKSGIYDENKNISHCLLFWGPDIQSQCELALDVARLLNCSKDGNDSCDCLNCKWVREQTHPAVKIYTRLDFKEGSSDEEETKGKKNINIAQAKSIISELSITSDYHRVYIFCDRDEEGNLLPLNQINFPEATSNALLKTFEEPPKNTTFIFLTKDKSDIISTVVSRAQSFFVPSVVIENQEYNLVEDFISNYWTTGRNQVLDFENKMSALIAEHGAMVVFSQIQNYLLSMIKTNSQKKPLFYKFMDDMKSVEDAKRQISLTPAMNIQTVVENLSFKMILQ